MTGGNALAAFIKMIQQWVIQLGVNVTQVYNTHTCFILNLLISSISNVFKSKIWETALAAGLEEKNEPSIDILPTIFGERHSPQQKGTAVNINQVGAGLTVPRWVLVKLLPGGYLLNCY